MVFLLDVSPLKNKDVFERFFVSCKEYRKNKMKKGNYKINAKPLYISHSAPRIPY